MSTITRLFRNPHAMWLLLITYTAVQLRTIMIKKSWSLDAWHTNLGWWDAGWYTGLSTIGYHNDAAYAFFPLWPMTVRWVSAALQTSDVRVVGTVISCIAFIACLWLLGPKGADDSKKSYPESWWLFKSDDCIALVPLVFAPAAWAFSTNHTESMFLLLSVLAFQQAFKGNLIWAAIFAGLSSITRNQGVLVAVAVGLHFVIPKSKFEAKNIWNFLKSGLISGGIFSIWLLFQYIRTGNIFASIDAQQYWGHMGSSFSYIGNMFAFGHREPERELLFWGLLIMGIVLAIRGKEKSIRIPIGFYLVASALLWPFQGDGFQNAYRYSLVVFPFWLAIGHGTSQLFQGNNYFKFALSILIMLAFVEKMAWLGGRYYTAGVWPY